MSSTTREKLIHSAQTSMMSKGYGSTGVDDICRDAGVSKGAFYHQFASKEHLAIAALGNFYESSLKKLLDIDLRDAPPEEQFLTLLDAMAERGHIVWESGCLMGALASEMARSSQALQIEVSRRFSEMVKALEPIVEPFIASLQGTSLSAAALAEHYLVTIEGAIIMSRAHNDPMKINQATARFAEQLRSLPRRKTGDVQKAKGERTKR